ncbi:hypothetical protein [Devosia sp. 919]|uniref:hypothetical protein n=1 Tax=Devosia sp. 919 TaxID=2726065 RepID=UPI0015538922|nr:hypothetical protein [Devosia sp. 919]
MSIRDAVASAVDRGELAPLSHKLPGVVAARHVFVTGEVWDFVTAGVPKEFAHKAAEGRRMLDSFTAGNRIVVSLNPHEKPAYCQLSRNDPVAEGVWEFRIRDPKPQLRIFGCFAECDVFIALSVTPKTQLVGRLAYPLAVADNTSIWGGLFPGYLPITGEDINAYISGSFSFV